MIEKVKSIQRGTVYRIKNRKTKKCLCIYSTIQLKTCETAESADQLWVFTQVKNEQFQITHLKQANSLTLVHGKEGLSVKLQKNRITSDQFWAIRYAETQDGINYFWIKPPENDEISFCGSALGDSAQLSSIDSTLNICLWSFQVYPPENEVLANLSMFRSLNSNLFLDVSDIASKEGAHIIQYLFTGTGNQRWVIEPFKELKQQSEHQYTIQNYSSGLNLSAISQKGSFRIIQAICNNQEEQRWKLIPVKEKTYLIQSVAYSSYYLGLTNDKGGSLISLVQDRLKSRWIIEGCSPAF